MDPGLEDEMYEMGDEWFCSICDGLGHGYPGGRPCPLEEGDWEQGLRELEMETRYLW